jgi:glc operon protein GlcG
VKYRRPTKALEDSIQRSGMNFTLSLDDVIAVRGRMPLIQSDKIIGGIGCSGGASSQDEAVCKLGVAAVTP